MKIPITTSLRLFTNRKRRIINGAVFKKLLIYVLHLYNKLLAFVVLAIYIENGATGINTVAKLLRVEISNIQHILFSMEHSIQEADKQFFIKLRTEQAFEAKVSMWIYVFLCHNATFIIPSANIRHFRQ